MECVDFRNKYVIIGNLRLDIDCASDGTPADVTVSLAESGEGQPHSLFTDVQCEVVERVAAALAHVRASTRDDRRACPDHGYFKGAKCPDCAYVGLPG